MNFLQRKVLSKIDKAKYDVFISHRSSDTKRNVASLLYEHLAWLKLRPFLDSKNMKPGDKLFEKIEDALKGCKVGIAIFSPGYCESYFCMHELSHLIESKKKIVPIFCDVNSSKLRVENINNGVVTPSELGRFNLAVEEAKCTVGVAFDSQKGNWPDMVRSVADSVTESLTDVQREEQAKRKKKEKKIATDRTRIIEVNSLNYMPFQSYFL